MRCERLRDHGGENPERLWDARAWWHELSCADCRDSHRADRLIETAADQIRCETPPQESLWKTLAAAGCSSAAAIAGGLSSTRTELGRALALVGVGIFITTLAQPEQLGRSLFGPVMKGGSVGGVAGFWALVSLFWYLKPIAALLIERSPILRSNRNLCLVASVVGAGLLWLLPVMRPSSSESLHPAMAVALNALLAIASTLLGGYLVEQAQRIGASGRLGAFHQAAIHLAAMAAPLLGLAAGPAFGPTVAAILLAVFGVLAAYLLPERTGTVGEPHPIADQIRVLGRARQLWQVAAMLLLVIGSSSFETLLSSQQSVRGFSSVERMHLSWIAQAATLISIAIYAVMCRKVRLQSLLPAGIIANACGTLLYLAYTGPIDFKVAALIELVNGLAAALIIVTLFDLALRAVPRRCAYLGYAVLMSVSNIARSLSEVVSSSLSLNFGSIVILSALCSLLALLVVVRLPFSLVCRREGDPAPGVAQWAGQ